MQTRCLIAPAYKYLCAIALLSTLALSACGTTGATSRQSVELAISSRKGPLTSIEIEPVAFAPGASDLFSVGVFEWGRFDEKDLANIQGSLEDSVRAATSSAQVDPVDKLRVFVAIRHYTVAATNHSVAVLAAVDWCAGRNDGKAIYRELFYAADTASLIGTLGGEKDIVNHAIVKRIGESSLVLAQGAVPSGTLPRKVSGTFESFDSAAAALPAEMRSWPMPILVGPVFVPIGGTLNQTIPWWQAKSTESLPCESLLGNAKG